MSVFIPQIRLVWLSLSWNYFLLTISIGTDEAIKANGNGAAYDAGDNGKMEESKVRDDIKFVTYSVNSVECRNCEW